jgi:hypothetical protein
MRGLFKHPHYNNIPTTHLYRVRILDKTEFN